MAKYNVDDVLSKVGGKLRQELPKKLGKDTAAQWEKLENLSDQFELCQFSIDAIDTEIAAELESGLKATLEVQVRRSKEVIASAEEALPVGAEMLALAQQMLGNELTEEVKRTLKQQIDVIEGDLTALRGALEIHTISLQGFLETNLEISAPREILAAQVHVTLAQAPVDNGDSN